MDGIVTEDVTIPDINEGGWTLIGQPALNPKPEPEGEYDFL